MTFGKLPIDSVKAVIVGYIKNSDGTISPDPKAHEMEFFCGGVDDALFLAFNLAYWAPGCVHAQMFRRGKPGQEFPGRVDKDKLPQNLPD